ncbi:MAG: asparagine synthase (glutamine-hydrolyzing) [Syntrophobacteria bacterium]
MQDENICLEKRLEKAGSLMAHRGPDGEGLFIDGGVGLTHRRLAIIDISKGAQPLTEPSGQWTVVLNGEIYNFLRLRKQLKQQNVPFNTRSDSEVLASLLKLFGPKALEKLRGMFSFCAFDRRNRNILLARDRFGVKPLFYVENGQGFFFASEIPTLLELSQCSRKVSPEAIDLFLSLRYVPHPYAAISAIKRIPPGHYMIVRHGRVVEFKPYWTLNPSMAPKIDFQPACEELRQRFDEAVDLRLIADVPVGAFLSGGVDSTLTVASMSRRRKVKTYSVGFEEDRFNELPHAKEASKRLGTDHHELVLSPEALTEIPNILGRFGEPFANETAIPLYFLSKFAARDLKVVLTGDGGDEIFAGYKRYAHCLRIKRLDNRHLIYPYLFLRRVGSAFEGLVNPSRKAGRFPRRAADRALLLKHPNRYLAFVEVFDTRAKQQMCNSQGPLAAHIHSSLAANLIANLYDSAQGGELERLQYVDIHTYLPGDILYYADHMSMAAGLEVRSPFLDYKLVEYALSLPSSYRLNSKEGSKRILREAFSDRIPKSFFARPKKGFSIPLGTWLAGPLREQVRDGLLGATEVFYCLFSRKAIEQLMGQDPRQDSQTAKRIWSLFILAQWMRLFSITI